MRLTLFVIFFVWCNVITAKAQCVDFYDDIIEIFASSNNKISESNNTIFYQLGNGSVCMFSNGKTTKTNNNSILLKNLYTIDHEENFLGKWYRSDNGGTSKSYLEITRLGDDELQFDGDAGFETSGGALNTGYFLGIIQIANIINGRGKVMFSDGSETEVSNSCFLQFQLIGDHLIVLDSGTRAGHCGGYGVSFTGYYSRKSE